MNCDNNINIVVFDRIDQDPLLILMTVALNFKSVLSVEDVVCKKSKSFFLQKYFKNPYFIWIPKYEFDAEYFKKGSFALVYKYDNKSA